LLLAEETQDVREIPTILARLFLPCLNPVLLIYRKPVLKVGEFVLTGIWKVLVRASLP
jgi:hypothetical protein